MSQGIPRAGFTDVDRQSDPRFYVRHLERQQAVRQGFKDHTFALLDLGPGQRVLDIGCGLGRDVLDMARLVGPTGRVTGVDASRTMIDEALRRSREADPDLPVAFEQATLTTWPSPTTPSIAAAPSGPSSTCPTPGGRWRR